MVAGADRVKNEAMAYGAPVDAAGATSYSLEIAGANGDGGTDVGRGVGALALFVVTQVGSSGHDGFSHTKIAVPGISAPRRGLQPPQTCWFSSGHSGSTRSTSRSPAAVSSRTRSPRVR